MSALKLISLVFLIIFTSSLDYTKTNTPLDLATGVNNMIFSVDQKYMYILRDAQKTISIYNGYTFELLDNLEITTINTPKSIAVNNDPTKY
jgi:hypothetical protein